MAGYVAVAALVLDHDLRLEERVEQFAVEELVGEPAVERFDPGVLQGRAREPGSMNTVVVVLQRHQSATAFAMNLGPLNVEA